MHLLIVTDAFPPRAGGSGWSTHALAQALRSRGHAITIVQPRFEPSAGEASSYDGFEILQPRFRAPRVPFVRNYFRNERLYDRLGQTLAALIRTHRVDVVHGQHLLSAPAAVGAARRTGIVSVCTIRDYWPVCYWSDLMLDPASGVVCPGCSAGQMTRCVRPRGGALWPLGLPAIPYMMANLGAKRRALASADALVAVSGHVASDVRARAPELAHARIEVIPNPVDVDQIQREADQPAPMAGPYALYVGKLEPNKGSLLAVHAAGRARLDWPMVVVGDGSLRSAMDAYARGEQPRRPLYRMAVTAGPVGLVASCLDAGISVGMARAVQPRAAGGRGTGRAHRGDGHRRHWRHRGR